jgi:hypothetical protein
MSNCWPCFILAALAVAVVIWIAVDARRNGSP